MTFRELVDIYKEPHAVAKKLSLARTIDWRIRPMLERFGDWALTEIKTADIEDFIADLRKPRIVGRCADERCLTPASINRTIELLRHMLNWAVWREYLEKTPFRRGTETLIKKLREDNQRRRRLSPDEELRLLAAAPPHLRSMIITALDTGMRRGEMLALRFAGIDFVRGLITLRGETTKSRRTRLVPISTQRVRAVLEWLRLDAEGEQKPDEALVFSNEIGEPLPHFHDAWLPDRAPGTRHQAALGGSAEAQGPVQRIEERVPQDQPAVARPAARVRVAPGRARRAARAGPRSTRSRVDHHDRTLRQPEARQPADRSGEARERDDIRTARAGAAELRSARTPEVGARKVSRIVQVRGCRASIAHRSRGACNRT